MHGMLKFTLSAALALGLASAAWGTEGAQPATDEPQAGGISTPAPLTGKLYLDSSYADDEGTLHIVLSPGAVMQFQAEWPRVLVPVSFVTLPEPDTCPYAGGGAGASAPVRGSEGMGSFSGQLADWFDTVREIRKFDPESFDQGFMEGYNQSMAQASPFERALMDEIVPMSEGLSVDEAMGRVSELLRIIPQLGADE